MAVAPSTASSTDRPEVAATMSVVTPHAPLRTCVGCRGRTSATELLRVVVAMDAIGADGSGPTTVVPDPRRRAAGRGAWVHPDQRCVETAVRRRAFARALKVPGTIDPAPVCEYLAQGDPSVTPH